MPPRIAISRQKEKKVEESLIVMQKSGTDSFFHAKHELDKLIAIHERDVAEHEAAIVKARSRLAELKQIRQKLGVVSNKDDVAIPNNFGKRLRERAGSLAWNIRREAYIILKTVGYPLNRTELLERLNEAGHLLDRNDAAKMVGKTLWAADEFVTVDRGYWLADTPLPDAQEIPERRKRKWRTKSQELESSKS